MHQQKNYIIGGGIAGLSTAVYLIQEAGVSGESIVIFDEAKRIGGSLDATDLSESDGYVMRGVRMFEEEVFACTFDLLSRIPSLNLPGKNLREEFTLFNQKNKCYSKSRLLKNGVALDSHPLRLNFGDRLKIILLLFRPEAVTEMMEIRDYFSKSFFESNFWYEFCTVFAFQPWHSLIEFRRYFKRFIQSFPNIDTLETIEISPYNQYEFMVLPIVGWLKKAGVSFVSNTKIINLLFTQKNGLQSVRQIDYEQEGRIGKIDIDDEDFVFTTLGSIVANSALGTMKSAPQINLAKKSGAWMLWENIAKDYPEFGQPKIFNNSIEKSRWTSFTLTFRDPLFFSLIEKFIHKKVTSFGGVNLVDSNWFMSIVVTYKPYFLHQPKNVSLCWGFGLSSEKEGNFIKKKMSDCTGEEILTELVYHLGFEKHLADILKSAVCIPCTTPFVTSHFLPRKRSDRPSVVPKNSSNFAFLGQYCEIPNDIVFTVEYSVRSAQIAVFKLFNIKKKIAPIYNGMHHLKVLINALRTVFR